jgi:hypothetical protein
MQQWINEGRLHRNRRVDAHLSRPQFGQIMDRAVETNEPFVVECGGAPAVVIMSVQAFLSHRRSSARLAGESLELGQKDGLRETLRARRSMLKSRHTGARRGTDSRRHRHECSRVGHDFIVGQ